MNRARERAAAASALVAAGFLFAASAASADGATTFTDICAACHGEGGVGNPGLAPPLNLADFWAGLGGKAPDYIAGVLAAGLSGKISAGGMDYIGLAMPAQAELSDTDAAAVATYVLGTLGGQAGVTVTPEAIAAARAAPPAHADLRKLRKGG